MTEVTRQAGKRRELTFWEKAERFPPILCRLLAKHSGYHGNALGAPKTNAELAALSGLSIVQVVAISNQLDWRGIDVPTMKKFLDACEIDFENYMQMKRVFTYMRGNVRHGIRVLPKLSYLRRHHDWETFFKDLALAYFKGTSHAP